MADELQVEVGSQEEASQLQADFDELLARVNGELMFQTMEAENPLSVEASVIFAERAIEEHLREFTENQRLQQMAGNIKQRFRAAIEAQAEAARR